VITTTYTCDKCGHAQTNAEQMWTVGVVVSHKHYVFSDSEVRNRALWCRACVEKLHLLPQASAKPADIPQIAPTLEEMIREIVREEVTAMTGAA
jgi:hypothetical protein